MIPLADLKLHLKVDPDQSTDDSLIVEMEQAAVAYLQNETGKYFGAAGELVEVLSANGWASIWLQVAPTIDEDYQPFILERRASPSGDWEVVASTDYEVDGYRLYPLAYWTPGRRTLRATYWGDSGMAEGAEPADVQQAVRELVAKMYQHRKPIIDGSFAELPYGVVDVIRAHKIVVF